MEADISGAGGRCMSGDAGHCTNSAPALPPAACACASVCVCVCVCRRSALPPAHPSGDGGAGIVAGAAGDVAGAAGVGVRLLMAGAAAARTSAVEACVASGLVSCMRGLGIAGLGRGMRGVASAVEACVFVEEEALLTRLSASVSEMTRGERCHLHTSPLSRAAHIYIYVYIYICI